MPGKQRCASEGRYVDTVGDFDGIAAECLDLPPAGEFGYRDPSADLFVVGTENTLKRTEYQRLRGGSVKGRHYRAVGGLECQHRQARGIRFVNVQDVEVVLGDPLPN